ncbi:MAG: amino acid permease [Lachnospiraceae bacterium]|nr:amino acid permease [Lachnospiraceae bacterium]
MEKQTKTELKRNISPLTAWSLAFGCMIGWGAFVMPGTSFLPLAGPLGTAVALGIAAVIMLIIGVNYHYMIGRHPRAGGAFAYTQMAFGYEHSFLCAWFVGLSYISIIPLSATALPIIAKALLGDVFQFGFHYRIAGNEVYLGEILLSAGTLLLLLALCSCGTRLAGTVQTILCAVLLIGVLVIAAAFFQNSGTVFTNLSPAFLPDSKILGQVLSVALLAPWAFMGFETISQTSSEFWFPSKKSFSVIAASIGLGLLMYVLLGTISISVIPEGYDSWVSYLHDLPHLDGPSSIPVFYAANGLLGHTGLVVLSAAAICAVLTGMIGFSIAGSRLLYSMSDNHILPEWFSALSRRQTPQHAYLFLLLLSVPVTFIGKPALGWMIDIASFGAVIGYGYTSAAAYKFARTDGSKRIQFTGAFGVIMSLLFTLLLLIPTPFSGSLPDREAYLGLAVWITLGFVFYLLSFGKKYRKLSGRPAGIAIALMLLVFYCTSMWFIETIEKAFASYHPSQQDTNAFHSTLLLSSIIQLLLLFVTLLAILAIYKAMRKKHFELELEKVQAKEESKVKNDFLSNMSHDIRTPMNAIMGFTNLALNSKDDMEKTQDYLSKIQASGNQLVLFINDVLEMGRFQSGQTQLAETECSLSEILHDLGTMVYGQVQEKNQKLQMSTINVRDEYVYCDKLRLNQVLINLVSNAVKFTPEGGIISVSLLQNVNDAPEGYGSYELRIRDTGIGMDREFTDRIFEPFEREHTSAAEGRHSTGLGMAITKSIIDLMHGTIEVVTTPGRGTKFTIRVNLRLQNNPHPEPIPELNGTHALVIDGDLDACNGTSKLLVDLGMRAEWTTSGQEAVQLAEQAVKENDSFGLYIIDRTLPDMDGLDISRQIVKLSGVNTPLILMTTYDKLSIRYQAVAAGVNGFCSKPVFLSDLRLALTRMIGSIEPAEDDSEPLLEAAEAAEEIDFTGKRILLVDDNEINREVALSILDMYGFVLEEAADGNDAVEKVASSAPGYYDVVLMDIQMPVMNGYEATKAIRALDDPQRSGLPIIAMTANAFEEDKREAMASGMNGHIAKPIDIDLLLELLGKLLREN